MSHLEDIATRFQVYLEGLKTSDYREFNRVMKELTLILEASLGGREIGELSKVNLERLIKTVTKKQTENIEDAIKILVSSMKELAGYSYEFEAGAIMAGTSATGLGTAVKTAKVWEEVLAHPLSTTGTLLEPWLDKLTDVQITSTENMLRRAHVEGWNNRTMMQAFRGTRANRFMDGIVKNIGRSNETVIRTAIQHVNSVARLAVWKDNADIIEGYRWVSTLDGRTSADCRSLDGREFKVGKGPLPPIHPNCRSTTVAVLDPVFDVLEKGATRASATGPVPARQTYYEWLQNQSAKFQDSVIGPRRGELLRNGGLSSAEFARLQLSRTFEPLTLDEMRRLKPLAFERAGI